MSDDRRIVLAAAGRRPLMVVLRGSHVTGYRRGTVRNPGGPGTVSRLRRSPCSSSRQHRSGCHRNQPSRHVRQGQQNSGWSGCGSERQDRTIATTGISLFRLFPQLPSRPPHFSRCLSCMTCWSQLSSRPQRLPPIFFPCPCGPFLADQKDRRLPLSAPLRLRCGRVSTAE
jgi:hypothetical protein